MDVVADIEIGHLYEYISNHGTILWEEKGFFERKTKTTATLVQIKKGNLFVLLNVSVKPDKPELLICQILMVQSGLMGGIVCYKHEIQRKK